MKIKCDQTINGKPTQKLIGTVRVAKHEKVEEPVWLFIEG